MPRGAVAPPAVGGPGGAAAAGWQEHFTGDGRSYWYNAVTQQKQWERPF